MIKNARFVVAVPDLMIDDFDGRRKRLVAAKAKVLKAPISESKGTGELFIRTVYVHRIMFGQDLG
jgi:hypothetical protein